MHSILPSQELILRASFLLAACCLASGAARAAGGDFPKADPAGAFKALKVYGPDGSPIRQPVEDWAAAKQRAETDPEWRKWVAARRADVDDWMANRHDRADWIAGWWHDFVSPINGSFLTWTPEEPGPDTLHSPSDPHVALTPKLHAAWVFGFRSRNATHMQDAARLYRLTGETKYADWAASQLDFYGDHFTEWPEQTRLSRSRLMGQSLDEAVDLIQYVRTAALLSNYVTPDRKQQWFQKLFKPESELLNSTFQTIHNIACWQRSAVGHVAILYNDADLWKTAVDGPYGIHNQIARGVTSDYLWYEQSLGYNSYVVQALLPFFEYALLNGKAGDLTTEMESVENLTLAPIYLRFPTGQIPNPADGGAPGKAPNVAILADCSRIFPTRIGLAEASKRKTWDTLLDPPAAVAGPGPLPPVVSWNLESSRMAVIKSGPWQVYLHYGQLTASHAEAEALNYEAFLGDTDITHDTGTVGYGSPLHKGYYATAVAHNVPLIDGVGQGGWKVGKLLSFDPAHVAAAQPDYRSDASAERALAIDGDSLTDTVRVTAKDGKAHHLGLLLQLQGKVALPAAFQPAPAFPEAYLPPGFKQWTDASSASFTDRASFVVNYPGKTLRVEIFLPGPFTIVHASALDAPPRRRDVLFIRTEGTEAVFKTVLSQG